MLMFYIPRYKIYKPANKLVFESKISFEIDLSQIQYTHLHILLFEMWHYIHVCNMLWLAFLLHYSDYIYM